jgi:hypothetical protein
LVRPCRLAVEIFLLVIVFTAGISATTKTPNTLKKPDSVTITLTPSVDSPQFVGTSILWYATVQGPPGHLYDYRFSVVSPNQVVQIVRDFQLDNSFVWVPYTVEGTYQVVVTVRDITGPVYTVYAPVSVPYVMLPWVTQAGGSAVHATSHPLVALFSGPPCQSGHSLQVRFTQGGTDASMTTNSIPCSQNSANWYVAGMYASTLYMMHWEETGPNYFAQGPDLPFTTGPLDPKYPPTTFTQNIPPRQHDFQYPMVLFHLLNTNKAHWPTATDLWGNIMWYVPGVLLMTRVEPGGNVFAFPDDLTLSEYDLAGNEILRTNVSRINEQLTAQGFRTLDDFNIHETRRMPNGNILLLGSSDLVSTQYQGGTKDHPVDIIGDLILVLDHNLQLIWAWDSFLHEDLNRLATQGEICKHGQGGCPRFDPNFTQANDWLHTNSAQYTDDGNIILSQRHQDWVLKVNYQNGQGDGSVLWRMGPFGDFTITNPPQNGCGDPNVFPWFTHQHDAAFQSEGGIGQLGLSVFTVFDDGNLRVQQCSGGNSRGMVLLVNEQTRTVTIETQGDLGGYSAALGSADLLPTSTGIYSSYGNGALGGQNQMSQSTELDLNGNIVFQLQVDSWSYRIYRRRDLYTPTWP